MISIGEPVDTLGKRVHLSVERALGVSLFVQLLGQPLQGRLRLARSVD